MHLTSENKTPGLMLWFGWVMATTLSVVVGMSLAAAFVWVPPDVMDNPNVALSGDNAIGPTSVYAIGLVLLFVPSVALAQGLVLLRLAGFSNWRSWVVLTALGSLLALLASVMTCRIVQEQMPVGVPWFWAILAGIILGVAQWPRLQRYTSQAVWWIPASGVAWLAATIAGSITNEAVRSNFFPYLAAQDVTEYPFYPHEGAVIWVASWAAGAVIYATITGVTLVRLLRWSRQT